MSNTMRSTRTIVAASAVLASALAGSAITPETASATTPRSSSASRCAESYVPLGNNTSFPTWLFGKTTLHIRNPKDSTAYVQWSSGPSSGEVDIPPGGSSDLSRGLPGFPSPFIPGVGSACTSANRTGHSAEVPCPDLVGACLFASIPDGNRTVPCRTCPELVEGPACCGLRQA
jgi:hypothetical protein